MMRFLPIDEFERLSCPRSLRMAQTLDEAHGVVRSGFVILGAFCHELCRLVARQFPQAITPNHDHPSNGWFARPYKGQLPASV